MSNTELKPCPFCAKIPELEVVGRDWVRLSTTCDEDCLLHDKEFDYSLSEENKQTLIRDWNKRALQDNWIPIENINLKDNHNKNFLIQLKKGSSIIYATYINGGGFREHFATHGDSQYISDVEYYQPLPEPKR